MWYGVQQTKKAIMMVMVILVVLSLATLSGRSDDRLKFSEIFKSLRL